MSRPQGGHDLQTAQPTYRTQATPAEGLDLEAVDAGLATDAELDARDLKRKAVFFYTTSEIIENIRKIDTSWPGSVIFSDAGLPEPRRVIAPAV